ncbi:unnamed protein product [Callosobruchus maculatus]|uniref:MADF domain-containing protein n=1 Tax=Callosobruchus maculatus TaxID=64391 RepID=A0A653BH06_CALMS|nr:unnamed protein product [Callosobruchus maculatus]
MVDSIDNDALISLVEARPVLWDKTLDWFKDRNLTRGAWREVCRALNHQFEVMEDKEKNAFGKEVTKRWANLRDAFLKSQRKLKECKRSGGRMKKYVYADQMQFLNKLLQTREVAESLEGITENNGDEEVDTVSDSLLPPKKASRETTKPQEYKRRRRRRPDELELKILKALEAPAVSPHISFFQGLLPHLHKFDDSEILEFQMGVLEVISKINNKRKNNQSQPLPSQRPPDHSSNYSFLQYQSFPTTQMSHSRQFVPINSFQSQQPQTRQSSSRTSPQTQRFRNLHPTNSTYSNHQQACSSKRKPIEHQQDRTSSATPPETYPSSNPSPAGSMYSDTTYDLS